MMDRWYHIKPILTPYNNYTFHLLLAVDTYYTTYIFPAYLVARFMDNEWYRAEIQQVISQERYQVHYVDYGNCQVLSPDKIARLPEQFTSLPPQAKEFQLFLTVPPQDVSLVSLVACGGVLKFNTFCNMPL